MVTKSQVKTIITDIHVSLRHRGERKTHKKIMEMYANVENRMNRSCQCHQSVREMHWKAEEEGTGARFCDKALKSTSLNQIGQVHLTNYQSLANCDYGFILHYKEYHLTITDRYIPQEKNFSDHLYSNKGIIFSSSDSSMKQPEYPLSRWDFRFRT